MNASPHLRGLASTRFLKAQAAAKGDLPAAVAYAVSQNWKTTPDVVRALKAAMGAMNTEDESALLGQVGTDYAEFLRPQTIIGRLSGLVRVPFETRLVAQSGGATAYWVGEQQPKPVTLAEFSGDTMPVAKVAAISVVTEELAKSSAPSAESALSRDLNRAGAAAMDAAFIDPANAGIPGVMPASITNGEPSFVSSGGSVANIDEDLAALIQSLVDAGSDLTFAAWVMLPRTAIYLSRLRGTTDGAPSYPFITAKGGNLMGLPVVTSGNVPVSGSSGSPSSIVLLDAAQIAIADDGESGLSVTTQATVQMETTPETGAARQVSLWQNNLVGLRAERMVNWKRRQAGVVASLTGVTF
jgi:HK97 family phage major capsid protein